MSLHYNENTSIMEMYCDACGEEGMFDGFTFQDCIDQAKKDGWMVFKDGSDEWSHHCPACRNRAESAVNDFEPYKEE